MPVIPMVLRAILIGLRKKSKINKKVLDEVVVNVYNQ